LTGKRKIKTEALIWDSGFASSVGTWGAFVHFRVDADWTGIKDGIGVVKLGDSINIFMGGV
jgi:hypothetical protein